MTHKTNNSLVENKQAANEKKNSKKREGKQDKNYQEKAFEPTEAMQLFGAAKITKWVLPERKQHWGKFIGSGQLGMIFAPRGTGKTFFVLALAIAMTTAATFLENKSDKKRRVIVLDGEMDLTSIQQRLLMIGDSLEVPLSNRLRIFSPETFCGLMPAITTVEGQNVIDDLIEKDWDILFIDNYSAWSADGRETPESWAPLLRWMLVHKREGRTVIVIHHSGKNGQQRGSSKHEDALDFSISLNPIKIDKPDGSLNFKLVWKKARHLTAEQTEPFCVTLKKGDSKHFSWSKTDDRVVDDRRDIAIKMREKGRSMAEIASKLGVNKSTVSRCLKT